MANSKADGNGGGWRIVQMVGAITLGCGVALLIVLVAMAGGSNSPMVTLTARVGGLLIAGGLLQYIVGRIAGAVQGRG